MNLATTLFAATIALPTLAADLTIDDVAPPNTTFVMRIHNWPEARTALQATPMWETATQPQMKAWFTGIAKENFNLEGLTADLEQLGVTPEEFPQPDGHVGLAVWMSPEEYASPSYIALAHFGQSAEDMYGILLDNADLEEDRGNVTVEIDDDDADHEIMTIRTVFDPEAEREAMFKSIREAREFSDGTEEDFWDEMEDNIRNMEFPEHSSSTHIARSGGWILASNELEPLEDALAVLLGDEIASITGTPGLEAMRNSVAGSHADAVVLPSAVADFFDELTNAMGLFLPVPPDSLLGLEQIRGLAAGITLDAPDGQMDLTFAVPLEAPTGIFTLIDELDTFDPPPFVPSDVATYSAAAVEFSSVLPLAREFVLTLPEEARAQVEASLTAFSLIGGPILESIGPEYLSYSRYTKPFSPNSESVLAAIRVKNEAVIAASLAQYAQAMGGQARDFLGNQIWEAPAMLGDTMAVGLGAGWAFVGPPAEVEDAFRRLSAEAPDSLSTAAGFKSAKAHTEPGASAYAFLDLMKWLRYATWAADHSEEIVRALFATEDWADEEYIQFMIEDLDESPMNKALKAAPDADAFTDAINTCVQEYHLNREGIKARWLVLRPE